MGTVNLRFCLFGFVAHALLATSYAEQWWDKIPFVEWSAENVDCMLNDSPWVSSSPVSSNRRQVSFEPGIIKTPAEFPIYRIRLLTARPIREALSRRLSFNPEELVRLNLPTSVDVNTLNNEFDPDTAILPIDVFVDLPPTPGQDDLPVIVSITRTRYLPLPPGRYTPELHPVPNKGPETGWIEEVHPKEFLKLQIQTLAQSTFLSTENGKRVSISGYKPPAWDRLGAKFYFPRRLPDGRLLISAGDVQLRFETEIWGGKVRVAFDLKKMMYREKLEF